MDNLRIIRANCSVLKLRAQLAVYERVSTSKHAWELAAVLIQLTLGCPHTRVLSGCVNRKVMAYDGVCWSGLLHALATTRIITSLISSQYPRIVKRISNRTRTSSVSRRARRISTSCTRPLTTSRQRVSCF